MDTRCPTCNSCGMPLEKPEDFGSHQGGETHCVYCVNTDGTLKSYEEVLQGTVEHLVQFQGLDHKAAEKMAIDMLQNLPAWKSRR